MKLLVLLFASASAFTTGCLVGEEIPTDDDLPPERSEAALSNHARTAFNFFVAKGLTQHQAAGVVGNLMQESSVRPTAVEYGGGPGRGIAQWSVGGRWNTDRKDNIVWYTATYGGNRWDLNTQLDFTWYELETFPTYGLAELRAATTLSQAVYAFQNKFERCGKCAAGKRIEFAQQALAQFGGGSGGGGGNAGATCWSGTLERAMPVNACVESKFDNEWYQCAYGEWVDRWSNPDACNGEYPLAP